MGCYMAVAMVLGSHRRYHVIDTMTLIFNASNATQPVLLLTRASAIEPTTGIFCTALTSIQLLPNRDLRHFLSQSHIKPPTTYPGPRR